MTTTPADAATQDAAAQLEAEASEQMQVRLAKRDRLNASGLEAYPVSLPITTTIAEVRARFGELEPDATTGEIVGLAGRIVHLRNTGKLCFASLQSGEGSRIQAMVSLAVVGEEALELWKELVELGDHLFVSGEVVASRRGELSVMVKEWKISREAQDEHGLTGFEQPARAPQRRDPAPTGRARSSVGCVHGRHFTPR